MKDSWYRSIIRMSAQFLSYVKAYKYGQVSNSDPAPAPSTNAGIFIPQQVGELTNTAIRYQFPSGVGYNSFVGQYRQDKNYDYELLPSNTSSSIIPEFRRGYNFNWGYNQAIGLRGSYVVRNQATENYAQTDSSNETYWRRYDKIGGGKLVDMEQATGWGTSDFSKDHHTFCITPFERNTSHNIALINRGNNRPVVYPMSSAFFTNLSFNQGANMSISFFVWKGWVNKDWETTCENVPTDTDKAYRFNCPTIGLKIQNADRYNNADDVDWIDQSSTYININYVNENFNWTNNDIINNTLPVHKKCWSVKNVQFEEAPNNYVRVMISLYVNQFNHSIVNYGYPVTSLLWGNNFTDANWMINAFEQGFNTEVEINSSKYLVIYGWNYNMRRRNTAEIYEYIHEQGGSSPLLSDYKERQFAENFSYFNNYLSNDNSSVRSYTNNQLYVPNPNSYASNSGGNFNRNKCFYLHLYIGNSSHGANNQYVGTSTDGGKNLWSTGDNTPAIVGTQSCMNNGWYTLADDQYKFFLYETSPPTFPNNPLPVSNYDNQVLIPKNYYVPLMHGHNKIVLVSDERKVYINGKVYDHDRGSILPQINFGYRFYGRGQDYILEYGWFKDDLEKDEALKLCQI